MVNKNTTIKKKTKKNIVIGVAHILATFNNTIVTITDVNGNVIVSSSAGGNKFKGSRKSTPHAAQITAERTARAAIKICGLKTASVIIRGPGAGREAAIFALQAVGLSIVSIKDATPIPHNGCRPRKRRRI